MPFANLIAAAESIMGSVAQEFITQGSSVMVQFAAGEMAKLRDAIHPAKAALANPDSMESQLQAANATIEGLKVQIQALQQASLA